MTAGTFTVTIDSLSYGGRGVGRRADGKVAFVPFVMPGEAVLARSLREHSSYCIADPIEILERSALRTDPECPLFTRCGGCDWQHMPYAEQVRWKNLILVQEVSRGTKLQEIDAGEPVPSPSAYRYRGHTVLQCEGDAIGFFRKKTNRVIPVESCPVLNPRLQGLLPGLKSIIRETRLDGVQSLELHAPGEDAILEARCSKGDRRAVERAMERMRSELGIRGVSFIGPWGRSTLGEGACSYPLEAQGGTVRISSSFGEFIQANLPVNQAMVDHVTGLAPKAGFVVDLYCGSGNFSIPLARTAGRVLGVEWSRGLVSQGRKNAERNGAGNVELREADVVRALDEMKQDMRGADVVVLDPPREGAKEGAELLPGLCAERIVYISCNPATLARDLKPLVQAGYALRGLRLFDMFPQTFHIEAVALLQR